ncbi:efflux RND transporter periplasmic adaptor subunit [bacterium]|nr:efflux RND transporter periplasmic adaptor subunit [bacterium]
MKKKIIYILIAVLIVIICTVVFIAFSVMHRKEAEENQKLLEMYNAPRPVFTEIVAYNKSNSNRKYPGSVNASREVILSFRVGGPLIEVNVSPGDLVKKNQVLMRIDPRDYKDKLRTLEARLSGVKAKLINTSNDYFRVKELIKDAVISTSEYDASFSAYVSAKALVQDYEAQIQTAGHQLEDTNLKAPFDGIITKKNVDNNEVIATGQPVIEMHYNEELEIDISVPESEMMMHKLNTNEYGIATFPTLKEKEFPVRLKEWDVRASQITRTYNVTFSLLNTEGIQIFPGMTAEVSWSPKKLSEAVFLTVLFSAILPGDNQTSLVWVYDKASSTAKLREIVLGHLVDSDRVIVLKGLKPGEEIITVGTRFITEKMKIKPVNSTKVIK